MWLRSVRDVPSFAVLALLLLAGIAACSMPAEAPQQTPRTSFPAATSSVVEEIGSLRNARVAWPMRPGERVPLVFLTGSMPESEVKELASIAPNLRIIAGLNRQTALAHAAEANGIDIRVMSPELLEKAPNLVWVQAQSAGVDAILKNQTLASNDRIVLANMRAVHGPAIADHAFAMLLTLTRNLRFYDAAQEESRWEEREPPWRSSALHGRTMLVVGLGGIGGEIAQRGHGFGMRVIATRRSDAPAPEYVRQLGKPEELLLMLPEADVVAVCVPLTQETDHLFDARAFAAMKRGAILINIARGRIVNNSALIEALRSGHLAGACLDVTDPEPLPADSPLWKMPNVIITPHTASDAEITTQRRRELLRENLRRFASGEPLLNVVDKVAGY